MDPHWRKTLGSCLSSLRMGVSLRICQSSHRSNRMVYPKPRVNIECLNLVLEQFALQTGAGTSKKILLVMDRAGWHTSDKVILPSGIYVEYLPPYSPEQQRAERLWSVADEPLVNKSFDKIQDLEAVLEERCQILSATMTEPIKNLTNYYWWPQNCLPCEG